MKPNVLESTVQSLLAAGRGILAADESLPTITSRFKPLKIESTEETRRAYRELLFTTPGLSKFISGVILFDETIRQKIRDRVPVAQALSSDGIIPGIKVDKGTVGLPDFADEKMTQGLDGLRERLVEYRELGARFTKWRAVIKIGEGMPTPTCIDTNARSLALFASLSQEAGLVPIVEPEVLMDGDHTLAQCEEVTFETLKTVFTMLAEHRVSLEGMLLKSGMVLPGKTCPQQADGGAIAEATLRCFRRSVPAAVPGIVFLSGGQSSDEAAQRLEAICRVSKGPWKLSFSFGRALQDNALKKWKGSAANVRAAQEALNNYAEKNSSALLSAAS